MQEYNLITLRNVNHNDKKWILHELRIFSEFFGTRFPVVSDDDVYMFNLIEEFYTKHIFIMAEGEAKGRMGFIGATFAPHIFNPAIKTLTLAAWWVSEPNRNSRAGYMLLKKLIEIGKLKADWIILAFSGKCPVKSSSIRKLGFKPTESCFLMEVLPCP